MQYRSADIDLLISTPTTIGLEGQLASSPAGDSSVTPGAGTNFFFV